MQLYICIFRYFMFSDSYFSATAFSFYLTTYVDISFRIANNKGEYLAFMQRKSFRNTSHHILNLQIFRAHICPCPSLYHLNSKWLFDSTYSKAFQKLSASEGFFQNLFFSLYPTKAFQYYSRQSFSCELASLPQNIKHRINFQSIF